jgi:hypothetical protein
MYLNYLFCPENNSSAIGIYGYNTPYGNSTVEFGVGNILKNSLYGIQCDNNILSDATTDVNVPRK